MDREGELYKSDVDDYTQICMKATGGQTAMDFIRATLVLAKKEIERLGGMIDEEFDGLGSGESQVAKEIDHAISLIPIVRAVLSDKSCTDIEQEAIHPEAWDKLVEDVNDIKYTAQPAPSVGLLRQAADKLANGLSSEDWGEIKSASNDLDEYLSSYPAPTVEKRYCECQFPLEICDTKGCRCVHCGKPINHARIALDSKDTQ